LRIFEREGRVERASREEGIYSVTLLPKAEGAQPHSEDARKLLAALRATAGTATRASLDLAAMCRRSGLDGEAVKHALGLLERAHVVSVRRPFAGKTIRVLQRVPFRELGLDLNRVREQERRSLLLLKRMTDYAYHRRCRRRFLLRYFGEENGPESCGHCDACAGAQRVISLSAKKVAKKAIQVAPGPYNELAASELRRWRRELAQDLQIPAFIIMNDKTLLALATALPTDRESFLAVKGTGESRWERFGTKIVEVSLQARAATRSPSAVGAD
jgi:ATP-dependent DNA helicase RecQ